jgi:hypothetical protein
MEPMHYPTESHSEQLHLILQRKARLSYKRMQRS